MPIYEYLCKKCGEFEVTQRITDKPLAKCPTCRGKVSKLISSTSFQLKGSGWYITDYGRGGSRKGGESESKTDGASTASAKSETSESKPSSPSSEGKAKEKSSKSAGKASKASAAAA